MKDRDFLDEAGKLDLEIEPVAASEIDSLLAELYQTPNAVVEKAVATIRR